MPLPRKFTDQLQAFCEMADRLATTHEADAVLFLMERPTDWARLRQASGQHTVLLAGDTEATLEGAEQEDFETILLNIPPEAPVYERLTQSLLEAVAEELLPAGASVVAVYSGFEPTVIDSLSIIRLGEHLGQLTVRDLRQLKTRIPLDTLKTVVDLAVDIGREGREGKPVGSLFVVGDHRKVLSFCRPMGFDPLRGYSRAERQLSDAKVREGVKEIAAARWRVRGLFGRARRGGRPAAQRAALDRSVAAQGFWGAALGGRGDQPGDRRGRNYD